MFLRANIHILFHLLSLSSVKDAKSGRNRVDMATKNKRIELQNGEKRFIDVTFCYF